MNLIIIIKYIKFKNMIYMQVLILNIHINIILIFYTNPEIKGIQREAISSKSLH